MPSNELAMAYYRHAERHCRGPQGGQANDVEG
jgi:hypothetical protein